MPKGILTPECLAVRGKGRPRGSKNKLAVQVKDMVLIALSNAGGVEYLERQAEANPAAFLSLVKQLLPKDEKVTHQGSVSVNWHMPRTALDV